MALATNQRLNTMNTLTAFTLSSLTGGGGRGGGRGGGGSSSSRGGSSSSKPRSSVQEQYLQERRRLEDSKWSLKEVLALTLEAERDREDQRLREQSSKSSFAVKASVVAPHRHERTDNLPPVGERAAKAAAFVFRACNVTRRGTQAH